MGLQSKQEMNRSSSLKAFLSDIDTQEEKQSSICFSNVTPLVARSTCLGYFPASKKNMEHSWFCAKGYIQTTMINSPWQREQNHQASI